MKVLYASCTCSNRIFAELFHNAKQIPGQQVQKYHRLIMEGMVVNGVKVKTITTPPIIKGNSNNKIVNIHADTENDIEYTYLAVVNFPIIKNLVIILSSFLRTLQYLHEDKQAAVICDVLNISVSLGALAAAKLMKRKNVGIVTDVPIFLSNSKHSLSVRINNILIEKFDSYVFLTQAMNDLINKRQMPYLVIEGQVDIGMCAVENREQNKFDKKVCVYAGALHKKYGIQILTEAFIQANVPDSELHIYGNGDFEKELAKICREHSNIKYFGVVPNETVVEQELKATLLVNPRPSKEEFTKYSFPSKNMEYMVSGTPVLCAALPGMPEEYKKYVFIAEHETVDGFSLKISEILSMDRKELHSFGLKAKEFVLKEKNNVGQSKKIIDMLGNK